MKTLVILLVITAAPAFAAGSGAGAGGAGHQRAINSGLPAGEAGPPGSPNNPRPTRHPQGTVKSSLGSKTGPAR